MNFPYGWTGNFIDDKKWVHLNKPGVRNRSVTLLYNPDLRITKRIDPQTGMLDIGLTGHLPPATHDQVIKECTKRWNK